MIQVHKYAIRCSLLKHLKLKNKMQSLSGNISLLESCIARLDKRFSLSGLDHKKALNKHHYQHSTDYYVNTFMANTGTETENTTALFEAVERVALERLDGNDEFGKLIYRNRHVNLDELLRSVHTSRLTEYQKTQIAGIVRNIRHGRVGDYV